MVAPTAEPIESRAGRLRALLTHPELGFLMEAHDGLSARIAEEEGFAAIWASGFSVSTSLGMRDHDEMTWSQMLAVVQYIVDASPLPVLVDGDTGYGNFNTARRFARRAEQLGAAGVCLEDKQFPKMNSFVGNEHQLADPDEFAAKIRACVEYRMDRDFCIVARTEAFIAGTGIDDALDRAARYRDAGADAIFVHSRSTTADEIERFTAAWRQSLPLIISPTTYGATPTSEFRRLGISAVIWANHSMRAATAAMRRACRAISEGQSVADLDVELASLADVFALMHYDELERDTRRYREVPRP